MQVALTPSQQEFVKAYMTRHDGVSVENIVEAALKALEEKDGFDMKAVFTAEEVDGIRASIESTRAEPYFASADMLQWLDSLGQVFHECA